MITTVEVVALREFGILISRTLCYEHQPLGPPAYVLAMRPWHTGCLFVSSHAALLSSFFDTSMVRSRLAS